MNYNGNKGSLNTQPSVARTKKIYEQNLKLPDTLMNGLIIILGSPNDDKGNLSTIALERCSRAIKEYQAHKSYKILITGGFGEHFNRTDKPHAFYIKKHLVSENIPAKAIIEFVESANTVEDVRMSKFVINKYNPENIIIVTSDYHHDRVKWLFERELPDRKITISCSKTELPNEKLDTIKAHEAKALQQMKINYY